MAASLLPSAKQTFFDANGNPLAGGKVYFYIPSTTTAKDTWQDSGKVALNTNPVVLDSSGQAVIYGDGTYRQLVKDSLGNTIWDYVTQSPLTALDTSTIVASAAASVLTSVDGKVVFTTKNANYTAVAGDNNAAHAYTAAVTVSITAAATLGANWHYRVWANGADIVIDPNASELINGVTTLTVTNGQVADIYCTGSAFYAYVYVSLAQFSSAIPAQVQTISASVGSGALTVGWTPSGIVTFRNATLSNGTPVSVTVGSALSLVVPSGATLGTINGVQAQLALILLYNAGTPALGIVNLAGGNNLDETGLISTTAISAAATSASTVYSTSAITNSPYRVIGYLNITETTAGTWATAPTLVQGAGGQAMAAMQSLGFGQTWQTVAGSRAIATIYYNTTSKPIMVAISFGTSATISLNVGGVVVSQVGAGSGTIASASAIVPPGQSYSVTSSGGGAINTWSELR